VSIPVGAIDCEQGSAEWFAARCGNVTSCRVADAIAKLKKKDGEAAVRRNLRFEIACEMLTGKNSEHYVSRWMEEGKEKEPLARCEYEVRNDVFVEQVGFVYHPTIKNAGASPDGVVGEDGMIEIKCPKVETHLEYLINGEIPEDYLPQMLWQLACCDERQWIDFVSFHPDVPEPYQLFVKRLERTEEVNCAIEGMEAEVKQFLSEVQLMISGLKDVA